MKKIELESDIGGYKVLERSDYSLKLQRKGYFWPIFFLCYVIIACVICFHVVVDKRLGVYGTIVEVSVFFLVLGIIRRNGETRFPRMIYIRRSNVSLQYINYLGGIREVSYNSNEIKSIHPGVLSGGRSSRVSAVRLLFINGQIVTLAFSSYLDVEKALDESQCLADMFSSITGAKIISQFFDESALTSGSS
ncbi:MAG: hypothetical protein ABSA44_12150 [Bacteroidota bacterium]|jgi:hypothetical protein